MFRRLTRALARLAPAIACCLFLGCGGDKTVRVSGKVTFQGKPVPAGKIYFMADGSKGNTGATGYADIKDGEYDTASTGGSGAPPGPVTVAIEGLDPSAPAAKPKNSEEASEESAVKLLFPRYETTLDVPTSAFTKDFEIPGEAAKGPSEPKKDTSVVIP